MGYTNVLHASYKEVVKKLMYFSPPTKCFHEDVLSNILHTILSEPLKQSLQLVLIKFHAVQSQHFKFPDILLAWPVLLQLCTKVIFHEVTTNKHQKSKKNVSKTKQQQKRNILFTRYKHNFRIWSTTLWSFRYLSYNHHHLFNPHHHSFHLYNTSTSFLCHRIIVTAL